MRLGTGHDSEHWFELLDSAGALTWRHSKITGFLESRELRAWWAEAIATAYEHARGTLTFGESWTATATRLVPADVTDAWHFIADEAERAAWLGEDWPVTAVREGRFVRLECPDGTDSTLRITPTDDTVRVLVQHAKLTSADQRESLTDFWEAALDRLANVLDWA